VALGLTLIFHLCIRHSSSVFNFLLEESEPSSEHWLGIRWAAPLAGPQLQEAFPTVLRRQLQTTSQPPYCGTVGEVTVSVAPLLCAILSLQGAQAKIGLPHQAGPSRGVCRVMSHLSLTLLGTPSELAHQAPPLTWQSAPVEVLCKTHDRENGPF
jgi:hypothetical protein